VELVDALQVLGLGDEQQLGVPTGADQRERLQQVPVSEVLAGRRELELVGFALASSRRQAGSTFRNVYLTNSRADTAAIIASPAQALRTRGRGG
jgi:hypothetical protein